MKKFQTIPAVDLKNDYQKFKNEIDNAIHSVLDSGWFILGPHVEDFEREFGSYIGTRHAIGVGSGTDALELSLRTCNIGEGDIVFTVSNTAVATVAAIELTGARPVFVDIDSETYTMSPASLRHAIKACEDKRAKAIIPVHLYGHPANMPSIIELARKHDLLILEDCAQSHGASIDGKRTGNWGDLSAFSFYPTKNLGAFGDAGIVLTNNDSLAENLLLLRQYGWQERYISVRKGMNTRLDEIQAAILNVKLRYLDEMNNKRRKIAAIYRKGLQETNIVLPIERDNVHHVYHQFVVRTENRDELMKFLKENGIGALIHYPVPVHLQPAYVNSGSIPHPLENTERTAEEIISLPISPHMSVEQVEFVVDTICSWVRLQ